MKDCAGRRFGRLADAGSRGGFAPPPRRAFHAFTLVELLTVLAIIGVLATLLSTGLASAKRKARQAACTSNLRQISLSFEMYFDDHGRRPEHLTRLVASGYLPAPGAILCPEDRTGNWGGWIERPPAAFDMAPVLRFEASADEPRTDLPYSYLHPLPWTDWAWDKLMQASSSAGIAACQMHGLGRPNLDAPSVHDFEGLVLRAQRDGAVVRRRIFWDRAGDFTPAPEVSFAAPAMDTVERMAAAPETWRLFTDEPAP